MFLFTSESESWTSAGQTYLDVQGVGVLIALTPRTYLSTRLDVHVRDVGFLCFVFLAIFILDSFQSAYFVVEVGQEFPLRGLKPKQCPTDLAW